MVDLDALGGAATGGLIASQFEKPTGEAGEHQTECADCGTETVGRFCHNCGNPSHVHRTLLHLGEELLHGVMHFDSRTWRTLPLLVLRPGRLTREWVLGKRTRYVSPLALFLFTIFVMFMAISYLPKPKESLGKEQAVASAALVSQVSKVAKAKEALRVAPPDTRADAAETLKAAEADMLDASRVVQSLRKEGNAAARADAGAERATLNKLNFDTGSKKLNGKLKEKFENPELALYKLQQAFYKFSFLLVPISIPFMALLFLWKKGFTLYDHGVFVLYSLTFMSLLVMVLAGATRIGGLAEGVAWSAAPFVAPAHMYYQLQGAYGLRTWSTLWRTWLLMIFSVIALSLFIAAILWFESTV